MNTLDPKHLVRAKRRYLQQENRKFAKDKFVTVAVPDSVMEMARSRSRAPVYALRSKDFLVQVFNDDGKPVRLSICRTEIDGAGMWKADISWDELQWIKNACGYESLTAVEIYPPAKDVVNVANMRHLWLYEVPFIWRAMA